MRAALGRSEIVQCNNNEYAVILLNDATSRVSIRARLMMRIVKKAFLSM